MLYNEAEITLSPHMPYGTTYSVIIYGINNNNNVNNANIVLLLTTEINVPTHLSSKEDFIVNVNAMDGANY